MSSAPTRVNEYDAIARTVQHYIQGAKSGRGPDMKPAFHQDATIFGYEGADLFAGPSSSSLTGMTRTVQPPDSKPRLPASTSSARLPRCGWNSTTGPGIGLPICSHCLRSTGNGRS